MNFFIFNNGYYDPNQNNDPGQYTYSGGQSWVYYLFGGIFVVLAIVCAWLTWKYRHSKQQYEHLFDTFGQFKRFWYANRFIIMMLLTIVMIICAVVFFTMNDTLASQSASQSSS